MPPTRYDFSPESTVDRASSDDVLAEALRYGLGFWLHATGPGILGAIVRLVGDDQQLAAIGTGGALRRSKLATEQSG
jgi:hypothetical protein